MSDIIKKFGRLKLAIAILLVSLVALAVAYSLIQTKAGLAVLTAPPPGIPGPYYVTTEAKIYGPVVDLAAIKSKKSGEYASDYTYVQWGDNPIYRVYIDNTLQAIYHGQMSSVMTHFSLVFAVENSLIDTFDHLKNVGAMDLSSVLGTISYFGNMPGVFISIYRAGGPSWSGNLTTRNSYWYATKGRSLQSNAWVEVRLNNTRCLYVAGTNVDELNASGSSAGLYYWDISGFSGCAVTLYFEDLQHMETNISSEQLRVYTVFDSPGTAFVSKHVSPSPIVGSTINVTVKLDPPSAEKINITDVYPNTFTWASVDVLLEKYKVNTGLEESVYVNVVPVIDGSNMKFKVYCNQAPSILQSLQSDEYIYLTYSLRVPDVAGEYTLPAATMSYLIPTPQT